MTEKSTALLFRCGLLLLLFLTDRRKPDYSRTVDDLAIRIKAGSMARAVPGFFGAIPMDDAVEVRADGGALMHIAPLVAIDSNFSPAAAKHGAFARFDGSDVTRLTRSEVILELLGDVHILPDVFGGSAEFDARGIIEPGPLVLAALHQFVENDAGDGAVCHPISGITGCDPDVLVSAGVLSDVCHVVDGFNDLA